MNKKLRGIDLIQNLDANQDAVIISKSTLEKVIAYLESSEKHSYIECKASERKNHIYRRVKELKAQIKANEEREDF